MVIHFSLFNDAVRSWGCVASNDWMISEYELECVWKETVLALFESVSWRERNKRQRMTAGAWVSTKDLQTTKEDR